MNAAMLSPDAMKLREIRAAYAAIAPADWTRAHDDKGGMIEARGAYGELLVLARFEAASVEEQAFAADAPDMVAFLLRLLKEAFREIRDLKGLPPRRNEPAGEPAASDVRNYAAECAMRCQDAAFMVFLEERHGLERPLTPERVAQKVRSLLGVTSRKEINNGGAAAEAWKALRADFAAWKKAGR